MALGARRVMAQRGGCTGTVIFCNQLYHANLFSGWSSVSQHCLEAYRHPGLMKLINVLLQVPARDSPVCKYSQRKWRWPKLFAKYTLHTVNTFILQELSNQMKRFGKSKEKLMTLEIYQMGRTVLLDCHLLNSFKCQLHSLIHQNIPILAPPLTDI